MGFVFSVGNQGFGGSHLRKTLLKRFGVPAGEIATAGRRGNVLAQPAVDAALEEMLFTSGALNRRLLGGEGVEQIGDRPLTFLSQTAG